MTSKFTTKLIRGFLFENEIDIIQNAVEYKGTVYLSSNRHDWVQIPNGNFIDGGCEYLRRGGNFHWDDELKDLSLTLENTDEEIFDRLCWGTFGINGDQPRKDILIKSMDIDHLVNCLVNVFIPKRVYNFHSVTMIYWLKKKLKERSGWPEEVTPDNIALVNVLLEETEFEGE